MAAFTMVNVVSYNVRDWEKAKEFYGKVLAWPVAYASDEVGWVEYGGEGMTHLSINRWESSDPMPLHGGATAVFEVKSVSEMHAQLVAMGVHCEKPVSIPGVVNYCTFYDPEGNRLQFAGGE